MDSKQTTPANLSPEEKARREKLSRDIETVVTFIALFAVVTVLLFAAYNMAAPFWGLPGANFFEVAGTLGLLYAAFLGVHAVIDSFK